MVPDPVISGEAHGPAVVAGDHDGRRARTRHAAIRPMAAKRAGGEIGRRALAGMLDVHEQRLAVRSLRDAGDLALLRADEEATQLALAAGLADERRHRRRVRAIDIGDRARPAIAGLTRQ